MVWYHKFGKYFCDDSSTKRLWPINFYKTAWRMAHLIREHMAEIDGDGMLGGAVEVDETFIGGHTPGGQGGKGKAIVLGML